MIGETVRVDVEVVSAPFVNHAMNHNRIPFLQRVSVAVPGRALPLEGELELSVLDDVGEAISHPWRREISVEPERPTVLDNPDLLLDPAAVATLEEEIGAQIVVVFRAEGLPDAASRTPIRVLAARQWKLETHAEVRSVHLLAAFVQPNHPAVAELLPAVSDLLTRRTGSGSLAGTGTRRDEIVQAVFDTLVVREISYALPPASWGLGQKVRGPDEVLTGRLGTCLDTTVLLASVLEHLGIPPVLWLAYGHAFVGWWRDDELALPDAASLQTSSAVNAVHLELMGVCETTMLTREKRVPKDAFRRSRQVLRDTYFSSATDQFVAVVDVAQSRLVGVLPMPARRTRPDGSVQVVEYQPPAVTLGATGPVDAGQQVSGRTRAAVPVPARVQAWKNELLDLSLRNPLLNYSRVTELPLVVPDGALGSYARMLSQGTAFSVRALDDLLGNVVAEVTRGDRLPGDALRSMLATQKSLFSRYLGPDHKHAVERLRYRARTALQESGANLLTLTLGSLQWKLGDRELTAPLLLAPAEFRGIVAPHRFALDPAGQITVNQSLLEKLRQEFGFTVPALDALPLHEEGDVDVEAVLRAVRAALAQAQLPFQVSAESRLAIINYTGYLLWRDLDEHWQAFLEKPLARHLALTPTQPFDETDTQVPADLDLDALVASAPIPMDGSQAEAVGAARAGRSFVLEGPPGTGKSQTITNLIADQMAQGRTVLFVAEKGAALDVVRARLEDVGLLPFTLDLHDHNARPTAVRGQLKAALTLKPQVDVDAYRIAARDAAAGAATLTDYARRLHERNNAGMSLYTARGVELAHGAGPALPVPPEAEDAVTAVQRAVPALATLSADAWPAWGFARAADPVAVLDLVPGVERAVREAGQTAGVAGLELLSRAQTVEELRWLCRFLGTGFPPPDFFRQAGSAPWQQAHGEVVARTASLAELAGPVLARFTPAVLLTELTAARQQLREAASSFFIGRKGRLLRAAAPALEHLRPGAPADPAELPELVDQIAAVAAQTARVNQSWQSLLGPQVAAGLNAADPAHAVQLDLRAGRIAADAAAFAALPAPVQEAADHARSRAAGVPEGTVRVLEGAAEALAGLFVRTDTGPQEQRRWSAGRGLLAAWTQGSAARAADPQAADLTRWVEARRELAPLEAAAPDAAWELLTRRVPEGEAVAAVERGLARSSVEERFATGGFRAFDGGRHDQTVARYLGASADLRRTLTRALPAAVIERRPFTTGRLFGKVAALEREVNRSRGGLSVRRLMEQYGDVIAEVTPCVLVSPDSLARFIPPGSLDFDLVVFDEASQIRVPDAVGAIGRATAVVVAGDSKQMPPSSAFGQSGPADEASDTEDFTVVRDEESILSEAAMAGVQRLWLSWHYRSRDESLIAFSNTHYYDDRLFTFPTVPGRGHDQGVSFTRVDGRFLRTTPDKGMLRTNPVEAAAVVAEVLRRWRSGERSIGVVTFNIQQRALIENMLLDCGEPDLPASLLARNDGVFVKNLENVQGDERDVIIFSTGFSANESGVLPLNFGPLNRSGGERRLNVAVSRARRRVMVFCSFEPEDIRADQTSSVGIAHLRRYLEMARDGAAVLDQTRTPGATDRHRDEIAARLREAGLAVEVDLGLSEFRVDLAVGLPGEPPVLAVLLDGPGWAARRTTGDRDGLPHTVLGGQLGWPGVERVWLPDWLRDADAVVQRLVESREQAANRPRTVGEDTVTWVSTSGAVPDGGGSTGAGLRLDTPGDTGAEGADRHAMPSGGAGPAAAEQGDGPAVDPVGLTAGRGRRSEFTAFEPRRVGPTSHLDNQGWNDTHRRTLTALIAEIVEAEGPVGVDRLCRQVVRCYGLSRLTSGRKHELAALVPAALRRDEEGFVYPDVIDPVRWDGYRATTGPLKDRPLEDVAVVEIANAAADVVRTAMGVSEAELLREVVRIFGGTRVGSGTEARLRAGVALAVQQGRIAQRAGLFTPV